MAWAGHRVALCWVGKANPPKKRPGLATELLPELLSSAELDPGSWHLDEDDRDDEDLYIMPMCGFLCVSRKMTTFCIWVAQMSTFSRRSVGDPCESRKWYTLLEKWALSQKAKLRKMSTFCMLLTINVHFFYLSVSLSRFILALCHQYEFWHVVSRYKSPTLHNSHWLSKHKSWIKKNCALLKHILQNCILTTISNSGIKTLRTAQNVPGLTIPSRPAAPRAAQWWWWWWYRGCL